MYGLTFDETRSQATRAYQSEDGTVWVQQSRYGGASSSGRPMFDTSAYGGSGARRGASEAASGSGRGTQPAQFKTSKSGWAKPPVSNTPRIPNAYMDHF